VLTAVDSATAAATRVAEAATCDHAPWGSTEVSLKRNGPHAATVAATVMDAQARVLAVAAVAVRGSDWSPFVRITTRNTAIRFTTLDGNTVECRIRSAD